MQNAGGWGKSPYHFCSFSAGDGEFKVCIFFPISKKKRKLCKEAIVDVAHCRDGLRIGVAVDSALECLCAADKLLPGLEVVWIIDLSEV